MLPKGEPVQLYSDCPGLYQSRSNLTQIKPATWENRELEEIKEILKGCLRKILKEEKENKIVPGNTVAYTAKRYKREESF